MSEIFESVQAFYNNNFEISVALAAGIIISLFVWPKETGKLAGVVVVIALIGYLILALVDVTTTGISKKDEAGSKTDKEIHEREK